MTLPEGPDMDSQHEHPALPTLPHAAPGSIPDSLPEDPDEGADLLEDRRRQRDRDYDELGGEA
ncbi:hypothetical protein [Geodermatophilus normandii]|uniref:Uncharacterized protein n=1 Tax=Geodermatophilus normandii TaxID=1137989 RepID=A0A6P0GGE3_9ACTN|nr:hypothetical protein [Geodermatophilus normandii]NEM06353.1 hypothetical protein [Geodermatophilus normandii]